MNTALCRGGNISTAQLEVLRPFARRYIWWKTPDEALRTPLRVIAQVMNMGDYADVQDLSRQLGDEPLRLALRSAEAGQFNARSWHYRLGLAEASSVPPLPVRKFERAAVLRHT